MACLLTCCGWMTTHPSVLINYFFPCASDSWRRQGERWWPSDGAFQNNKRHWINASKVEHQRIGYNWDKRYNGGPWVLGTNQGDRGMGGTWTHRVIYRENRRSILRSHSQAGGEAANGGGNLQGAVGQRSSPYLFNFFFWGGGGGGVGGWV